MSAGISSTRRAAEQAKQAARQLAALSDTDRNRALDRMAEAVEAASAILLAENKKDLAAAAAMKEAGELSDATISRLTLTPDKIREMVEQIRSVKLLPDPLGRVLDATELDTGLNLQKISVPLGLLAVIFEARPDAVTQIAALALKSGNAVLLKPGKEVEHTAQALVEALRQAIYQVGLKPEAIALVMGREQVREILGFHDLVDLVIPRGSKSLVEFVQRSTSIPVLGHAEGVCHIYVDASARSELALRVIDDAKRDYPAACNAVETVLLHESLAESLLPELGRAMQRNGIRLLGDDRVRQLLRPHGIEAGAVQDWHTEYGDLTIAIKLVKSLEEAMEHIATYGSSHTEAILTEEPEHAERFLREVDAAGVFHNASTRFSDGFRYGFGAEVGISTARLHARGPVGLDGLTTYKYVLRGEGQTAGEYRGPDAKKFTHRKPSDS